VLAVVTGAIRRYVEACGARVDGVRLHPEKVFILPER